jgi:phytoene dehydrogenase-like protein
LDGGWQTLVDGLRQKAVEAGAVLLEGRAVTRIEQDGQVRAVLLEGEERLETRNAVITAGPAVACRLVREAERTSLEKWKEEAKPLLAACLDLALKRLPVPDRHLVIGVDRPVFFTHHSRVARLSEDGSRVVHLIKYLGTEPGDAQTHERELEQVMDRLHPGWRNQVVARHFLPHIVVSHDSPTADKSTFPGPAVPEVRGLYVAGDGYGHDELLADAALASAKRAAEAILRERPAQGEGGRMDGERGAVRIL